MISWLPVILLSGLLLFVIFKWGCRDPEQEIVGGVSWHIVQHEMRGTSKKAKGRMQQRKGTR